MAKKQTMDHAQLLVLSLLAGEDMYGYQMIETLARRSDHTFDLKAGTLYPLLHSLERDKLVTARTGIHTVIADDAISCVALGTGKSLDSLNAMQDGTMNLSRRKQMT